MYRVLLKVDRLMIRIKEMVEVQIVIKKQHQHFYHTHKDVLMNGMVQINKSSQFFIAISSPNFQIQVILMKDKLRKLGGLIDIDLQKYTINTSNQIVQNLSQSPLQNFTLSFNLCYLLCDRPPHFGTFYSISDIQALQNQYQLNKLTSMNQYLAKQKIELSQKIKLLKSQNEELKQENFMMEDEMKQNQKDFNEMIRQKEKERQRSMEVLEKEKGMIAEIVDIINQSQDASLIGSIENIINKK